MCLSLLKLYSVQVAYRAILYLQFKLFSINLLFLTIFYWSINCFFSRLITFVSNSKITFGLLKFQKIEKLGHLLKLLFIGCEKEIIQDKNLTRKKEKINWKWVNESKITDAHYNCFFSVTPLREKHPPQHTQDVQALPPKIPNLVVPRQPVLSIIITITITHTLTHCLEPNYAFGHHSPWDLWEGKLWTVNGKDVSLCSWCRPFIFQWPSVYFTWLSLWENIQTILRTTRLRDKPSLWLFGMDCVLIHQPVSI